MEWGRWVVLCDGRRRYLRRLSHVFSTAVARSVIAVFGRLELLSWLMNAAVLELVEKQVFMWQKSLEIEEIFCNFASLFGTKIQAKLTKILIYCKKIGSR